MARMHIHGFLGAIGLLLCACGASSYDGVRYDDGRVRYSLASPPEPWRPISVEQDRDLAWSHAEDAAVLHASGSCNPRLDIPLQSLTNHLLAGFRNREILSQERRILVEREALDTHLQASLDGVMREMRFVVLKKDNCTYDFSLVAPPGERFNRHNEFFERWLEGFEVP